MTGILLKNSNNGANEKIGRVRTYTLQDKHGQHVSIRQTNEERELGIIITLEFKFSAQTTHSY